MATPGRKNRKRNRANHERLESREPWVRIASHWGTQEVPEFPGGADLMEVRTMVMVMAVVRAETC
jgi:hypothetical protein